MVKTKSQNVLGSTFVDVTEEKLVGGAFCPPSSIRLKQDQIHRLLQLETVYPCQFSNSFLYSQKNFLKASVIFSVSDIILPPSPNIALLAPSILFEKFVLTTLQKFYYPLCD